MLLDVRNVTKSFAGADGPVPVLAGVDMALDLGQTLSLQGEIRVGQKHLDAYRWRAGHGGQW